MTDDKAATAATTAAPTAGISRRPHHRPASRLPPIVRSRWPIAVAEVIAAVVLALVLPRLERTHEWGVGLAYDSSAVEATLAAIAGGMITLTGFVLTAVTLIVQTVQAQSPRLLRALNRTDQTPIMFGTFIATFTFALLVLSQVRPDSSLGVSLIVALVMVLICAALFLRLLVTFRTALTTGGLARLVGDQTRHLIDVLYPHAFDPELAAHGSTEPTQLPTRAPAPDDAGIVVRSGDRPGIFQSFDEAALVALAVSADTEITFFPAVGDFVASRTPLARSRKPIDVKAVGKKVRIGPVRTLDQDPAYGLRLLVDIANRALSSAINDPTSAVQVLDQLDDLLNRLAWRYLGDGHLVDESRTIRVRWPAPSWDAYLALATDEITRNGARSLQVTRRLRALLEDLAAAVPAIRRPPVKARLDALEREIQRSYADPVWRAEAMVADRQGIGSARQERPH